MNMKNKRFSARRTAMTGLLAAVATLLMYLEFSVPFMPSFLKFDVSELPALIAGFAFGPIEGVLVCLIKNLLKLPMTMTGGVGELANFLLGVTFVLPASLLYRFKKCRKSALIGSLLGAFLMGLCSIPLNYFVTYPVYAKILPVEAILSMYRAIYPGAGGLLSCLILFNAPFTFLKGVVDAAITFVIYKRLSPILKGKRSS